MIVYRIVNTEKMRKIEINKMLLGLVLAFFSCISHADENRYWDDLDENSKSEIINTIDVDKNIMKLYLHEIKIIRQRFDYDYIRHIMLFV